MLGRDKVRKSIVIVGIIMAFILGTLVSAPSVTAVAGGEPFMFLQEEIDALNEIIMDLLNENRVLHYAQSTQVTLIPGEFVILAEWEIVKTENAGKYDRTLVDLTVYANIDKNVNVGWYKSKDGGPRRADWDFHDVITASHTNFEVERRFDDSNSLLSKYNHIAFAIENPPGEINGEVKDFSGTVTIHLPGSESLVKLP